MRACEPYVSIEAYECVCVCARTASEQETKPNQKKLISIVL